MLKAIAEALGVSADYLLGDENVLLKDKDLAKKFEIIQNMNGETRDMIINFLDLAIRDFKGKQAYSQ